MLPDTRQHARAALGHATLTGKVQACIVLRMPAWEGQSPARAPAVEKIIPKKRDAACEGVSADDPAYRVVHECIRVRVGTYLDANGTVRTLPAPELVTQVLVALPLLNAPADRFV